jgi:hypothetical protein
VAEAVAFIGSKVYLPVVLPPGLPHGLQLWHGRKAVYFEHLADGKTAAQLYLRFPHGYVILEYGNGGFDGCSASEARPARVGSHPAMIYTTAHEHRLYAEIVWPATPHDVTGRYGITGPFTAAGILRLARGMDAAVQAVKRQRKLAMPSPQVGC